MAEDKRRAQRVSTDRKASARIALGIELLDVSKLGARARLSIPLPVGALIKIGLGGGCDRHARVVWMDDGVTGFEFLAPLDDADLVDFSAAA